MTMNKRRGAEARRREGSIIRTFALSVIIALSILAFVIYFFVQISAERDIRNALFDQYKQRQDQTTKEISDHLSSDLDSVRLTLEKIAGSPTVQRGELSGHKVEILLSHAILDLKKLVNVDRVSLSDSNNIIVAQATKQGEKNLVGLNLSSSPSALSLARETKDSKAPVFSRLYTGLDGKYRIAVAVPILNEDNGQYLGMISASSPISDFFGQYGNIDDANSQYILVLDSNATVVTSPYKETIGKNFFEATNPQQNNDTTTTNTDNRFDELYRKVLSGTHSNGVYSYNGKERINIGYPVSISNKNGKIPYFVFAVTPTDSIYSQIDPVLFGERLQTYLLLIGIVGTIIALVIMLVKWSKSLEKIVKDRTNELELAYEQLKIHDKMQQEFINIAAHELRTPIQPLLVTADMLESQLSAANKDVNKDKIEVTRQDIEMIVRNTKRLERLSSDILTVTRIESKSLILNKETVNFEEEIENVIVDIKTYARSNQQLKIVFDSPSSTSNTTTNNGTNDEDNNKPILVDADKSKVFEVLSNLLGNAIKFTEKGIITVSLRRQQDGGYAIVSIRDTGTGIHPDIMPRLFEKFATKSQIDGGGTGLGLFISKAIIEAHGGRIWAENNKDGRGATFSFSLPISSSSSNNNTIGANKEKRREGEGKDDNSGRKEERKIITSAFPTTISFEANKNQESSCQ